jgi:hypothetical protein
VNTHADPDGSCCELGLSVLRGEHTVARAFERNEERVALRIDLNTSARGERAPQDAAMFGEEVRVAIAVLLKELR